MQTQLEIIEQEEQIALEEFKKQTAPPSKEQPSESEEEKEPIVPLTDVLKEEAKAVKPAEPKPEGNQEDHPKEESEDSFDYEKEFETHGYKLNPEKKTDPRYLASRFYSTAGKLKELSNEKKQAEEKYKHDLLEQEAKIKDLNSKLETLSKSIPAEPVEEEDLSKELDEFDVDKKFIDILDKRYKSDNAKYEAKIRDLEQKLAGVEQDSYEVKKSNFWKDVYRKASPGAETLPQDVLDVWLEQPIYGNVIKKDVYIEALKRGDDITVAKFFSDCIEDLNKGKSEKQETIPDNIKSQVSAQPLKKSSQKDIQTKPIFTMEQIEDFDDQVRRGKISKDEEQKIEAMIQQAYVEGRIR